VPKSFSRLNRKHPHARPAATQLHDSAVRRAVEAFTDHAFVALDAEQRIVFWSAGAERLFGVRRDRVLGRQPCEIATLDQTWWQRLLRELPDAGRPVPSSSISSMVCPDGQARDMSATVVALRSDPDAIGYALVVRPWESRSQSDGHAGASCDRLAAGVEDTARRLAESNALLDSEIIERTEAEKGRLRLLRRLVAAQEEERRRIARDLHDDLGQRLTALRLTLEALDGSAEPSEISTMVTRALAMVADLDRDLDFLAWELRPADLEEFGLSHVLGEFVEEWSRHSGVRASFHAGPLETERFAPEVETSLYRIAQEALNNVVKHAHARTVNVLLEQRGASLVLVVEDDGIGFHPAEMSDTAIGLAGMRERAQMVGGTLDIEPTPEGGTTVLAHIPMRGGSAGLETRALADPHPSERLDPNDLERQPASGMTAAGREGDARALASLRARLVELQHAVAARDEFIATVAHELRNPVAPLIFQLRLAIEKTEHFAAANRTVPAEWAQSQLRRLEQRLHRLLETLDRLLDVSLLSIGRIDLQPEPMDLGATVREIAASLESEFAVARSELKLTERQHATGEWDRVRLEQVCQNLLSNAIRFGPGRPVDVSIDADEDFATLRVRDHGIGIAPDQQARIFERFERGADQRSGGFGIGLWVVRNICVAMGGSISVESQLGTGACFTVVLPRRRTREGAGEVSR
jgi:PAS domain S-box-containing protein